MTKGGEKSLTTGEGGPGGKGVPCWWGGASGGGGVGGGGRVTFRVFKKEINGQEKGRREVKKFSRGEGGKGGDSLP